MGAYRCALVVGPLLCLVLAAAGADASRLTQDGLRAFDDMDLDVAQKAFDAARKTASPKERPRIELWLGIVELERGNERAAQHWLRSALSTSPRLVVADQVSPKIREHVEAVRAQVRAEKLRAARTADDSEAPVVMAAAPSSGAPAAGPTEAPPPSTPAPASSSATTSPATSSTATGSPSTSSAATGSMGTGSTATGSAATGSTGTGSAATGSTGTGSTGTGFTATGSTAKGSAATGSTGKGSAATGSAATGSAGTGSTGTGSTATGSPASPASHTSADGRWEQASPVFVVGVGAAVVAAGALLAGAGAGVAAQQAADEAKAAPRAADATARYGAANITAWVANGLYATSAVAAAVGLGALGLTYMGAPE